MMKKENLQRFTNKNYKVNMNMELFKLCFNEVTCFRKRNLTPPRKTGVEFDGLVLSPL